METLAAQPIFRIYNRPPAPLFLLSLLAATPLLMYCLPIHRRPLFAHDQSAISQPRARNTVIRSRAHVTILHPTRALAQQCLTSGTFLTIFLDIAS